MDKKKIRAGLNAASVEHLKGRIDAEAMLEDLGIDVSRRQGRKWIMCHCPDVEGNHENGDASASFGFNEETLVYNCFVCGGGDVIRLVQMMETDKTDEEAVSYLEQFAELNLSTSDFKKRIQAKLNAVEEDTSMPDYPVDSLFRYRMIHPYLYERGLTRDAIVEMQVGFDEEHAGIVIPHFFMGKLVGMQWRHLSEDVTGYHCPKCDEDPKYKGRVPKYKNTPRFPKNNTLYGYDRMKEQLRDGTDYVIVVESPMSALKLISLGFNAVASFGQWSREQAMLLIAVPKVYFWPDNDAAGYENAQRAKDSLWQFVNLQFVPTLPRKKGDPGDLDTADEISFYLGHAYPASLFAKYSKDRLATINDRANTNT